MSYDYENQLEVLEQGVKAEYGEARGSALLAAIDRRVEEGLKKQEARFEYRREMAQREADLVNQTIGDLKGFDCPNCKNRGYTAKVKDYACVVVPCDCQTARRALVNIKKSGLENTLNRYTMENFLTDTPTAKHMKETALNYLREKSAWFVAGGQVGVGKTHICTAICGELLKRNAEVRYMRWKDDSTRIKGLVNLPEYGDEIYPYKNCDVLYIDDLWKPAGNQTGVTPADVRLLFEIINSRYESGKRTIVSSELTIDDIMAIDEAIGSRIYQRAKGYTIEIRQDERKNRRLGGMPTNGK